MYIPSWPCPTLAQFTGERRQRPFPLEGDDQKYFYVARNGIYHLGRALPPGTVLMPNYHSGNETSALRAAGVDMRFYPIGRDLQPDRAALERLCRPDTRALYIIHFMGWPQPMDWIVDFCRKRGLLLIEDCALSFLSETGGRALGSFGDFAVYCLYKTLPLPNGAILRQNVRGLIDLGAIKTVAPKNLSVFGRSMELLLESLRSSKFGLPGEILAGMKARVGEALTSLSVERERVGNIGFDIDKVDTAMSDVCHTLLKHLDYEMIVRSRRANYLAMEARLRGKVTMMPIELTSGVCPLFFPILVEDKSAVAAKLRARGIGVVEFWNTGDPEASGKGSEDSDFLRRHVLELPIHQNVTASQLDYIAEEVGRTVVPMPERVRAYAS